MTQQNNPLVMKLEPLMYVVKESEAGSKDSD